MENPASPRSILDEIFRTVDGQTIEVGRESWRLRVYGVHYAEGDAWVQLAALGSLNLLVTLRVPAGAPGDAPISIITRFFEQPEFDHEEIVDVTAVPSWAVIPTGNSLIH